MLCDEKYWREREEEQHFFFLIKMFCSCYVQIQRQGAEEDGTFYGHYPKGLIGGRKQGK